MTHADPCLFCNIQRSNRIRIVAENELAYAIRDAFPVTHHHTLIIPKRHVLDYFGLNSQELLAINDLLLSERAAIDAVDPSIAGYNVGMNCGESAGQSVWHCHVHLIPRRRGDVEYPKGGIRHVIPWKGNYSAPEGAL
jgi:diadenosine tetraphosphate (Ap4A) HIT family hydrolase